MDDFLSEFIEKKHDFKDFLLERGLLDETSMKTCLFLASSKDIPLTRVAADHTKDEEGVLKAYSDAKKLEFFDEEELKNQEQHFEPTFASQQVEYFVQRNPILPFKRIDEHTVGMLTSEPDNLTLIEAMERLFPSTVAVPVICPSYLLEDAKEKFNDLVLIHTSDDRGKQRIQYLCNRCEPSDVPFLIKVLMKTEDAENILKILNTLGRLRNKQALTAVEKYINHPDSSIRNSAINAKSKIQGIDQD